MLYVLANGGCVADVNVGTRSVSDYVVIHLQGSS